MSAYTPILKANPKTKPLARTLIAATAEQGVSVEEVGIACDLAQRAYQKELQGPVGDLGPQGPTGDKGMPGPYYASTEVELVAHLIAELEQAAYYGRKTGYVLY